MLFTEFVFLPFFVVCFLVYWALGRNRPRKAWLLLCSYVFYASWDPRFLSLIVVSTLIDYIAGLKIHAAPTPRRRRRWMLVSVVANLGMLGFFKYFNFFITSANDFITQLGFQANLPTLYIILPVGISFFTFQTMSYSLDIYYGKLEPTRDLLDLAFFVGFFPQLVAGPIVRAREFMPQLETARRWAPIDVKACLVLFLVGFVKKACIADNLAPFVDEYFAAPAGFTAASAWVSVTFYAAQIYCDFSGYTDMAIGVAGLLGYELTLNFHFPYLAANITDFWRRWHMSLSSWLRDYLYIPLGGNRGGKLFVHRNLMLTMLLGGLWHGAAWAFIVWGGLHGLALVAHKEFTRLTGGRMRPRAAWLVLGPALTFYWVCIAWIFFRAGSLDLMARDELTLLADRRGELVASLAAAESAGDADLTATLASSIAADTRRLAELEQVSGLRTALVAVRAFVLLDSPGEVDQGAGLLLVTLGLAVAHVATWRRWGAGWWARMPDWAFAAVYGGLAAVTLWFVPTEYKPFIYFQF